MIQHHLRNIGLGEKRAVTRTVDKGAQCIDVSIMRCPITKQALVYCGDSLLKTIDGCYAYPIKEGIFLLTAENAIDRTNSQKTAYPVREEKKIVRDFYNDFGWRLTDSGIYKDLAVWVNQQPRCLEFGTWCARQVGAYLPRSGTYLLDAGSGPVHPVYMEYHANYVHRICVDFSIVALQEAQKTLGVRGIYVLGDVTNLPFRDDAIDAVISNHVLYHVPADEQAKAFRELWRVTRPGGRAVVVYAWKALLPKLIRRFVVSVLRLKNRENRLTPQKEVIPNVYAFPYTMKWFRRENWPFKYRIRIFQVVSEDLLFYLGDNIRSILLIILFKAIQYAFPGLCGRYGQYPAIIIFK
jgi:ubiquinone/menaquinone biosynthesis C-methylase UbiE